MAWQRAKGELQSMLMTYYNEEYKYRGMSSAIDAFVRDVEDNGLHEE